MADQTTLSAGARHAPNGNGAGIVGSVTDLGHDVATLVELQAKLLAIDAKESILKAVLPTAVVAVCLVLMLAAATVGLFGIAEILARALSWSAGAAMLVVSVLSLALSGGLVFVSVQHLEHSLTPLRRTNEEMVRNLAWLKTVVLHSGRKPPKRA